MEAEKPYEAQIDQALQPRRKVVRLVRCSGCRWRHVGLPVEGRTSPSCEGLRLPVDVRMRRSCEGLRLPVEARTRPCYEGLRLQVEARTR